MLNFRNYFEANTDLGEVLLTIRPILTEAADSTRYSVEVNYRSTPSEVALSYAKIALGYVSAGLKQYDFSVKHVYADKPIRIIVSSRKFDDGEWSVVVSWNEQHKCFVITKGFFNKDMNSVSVQSSQRCSGENAFEITKQVYNIMHELKGVKDRSSIPYKSVLLKRGPKS